jgi:hypothetical protein
LRVDAHRAQRLDQRPDRSLSHVFVAIDDDFAVDRRDRRRQEARRRSGIAEKQRSIGRVQMPGTVDGKAGRVMLLDRHAHRPQGFRHQFRVDALQGAGDMAVPLGQRRQQQHAVGDGFGARRRHPALQRGVDGRDRQRGSRKKSVRLHGRLDIRWIFTVA